MSQPVPRFVLFLLLCAAYLHESDERLGFLGGIFPLITGIFFEVLTALGRRRLFKGIARVVVAGRASQNFARLLAHRDLETLAK